jgi:hypothetical protein
MGGKFIKVFDIAEVGLLGGSFALWDYVLFLIPLVFIFYRKSTICLGLRKIKEKTKSENNADNLFLGVILLAATVFFISIYPHPSLRDADCKMVEGPVENFDPMPYNGHKKESYNVQGVQFAYSDYILINGYNNTASHGGAVNKNSIVRICYIPSDEGNIIIRLEVKG